MSISKIRRTASTRNKVLAILAAGLVVGVGATVTLATWTDTEWVYGGNGAGGPGVGTSTFAVQQDATNPYTGAVFADYPTNPGNSLAFGTGALALTPGDSVAAPVALRTTAASVAGTLQLQAAVAATGVTVTDPAGALWDALELQVGWVSVAPAGTVPACTATLAGFTSIALTGTGLGAVPATGTQALQAVSGNVLHYCFVVSLPATAPTSLQGLTVAPAWQFAAVSS